MENLIEQPFDTERFIFEVEGRPCIWDSTCAEYNSRELKAKSWEELADIFCCSRDMAPLEKKHVVMILQKRWKNLRGCFSRELKRRRHLKAGVVGNPRKSQYLYFYQLRFLKRVTSSKDVEEENISSDESNFDDFVYHASDDKGEPSVEIELANIKTELDPTQENEHGGTDGENDKVYDEISQILACPAPKRKKTQPQIIQEESSPAFNTTLNDALEEDEDKMFLLSLVSDLRNVPQHRKMSTKIKIMKIINEAKKKK